MLSPRPSPVSDTPAPNLWFAGRAFSLEAYQNGTQVPLTFSTPITLVIEYTDADLGNAFEGALEVYYRKGTGWATDGITIVERDTANNRLVVTISHLSAFAMFGPATNKVYLPFFGH